MTLRQQFDPAAGSGTKEEENDLEPEKIAMKCNPYFTLCELVVVTAIGLVMFILLLPTLGASGTKSRDISCRDNLRGIGQGLLAYCNDNAGRMCPEHDRGKVRHYFVYALRNYVMPTAWRCPQQEFCSPIFADGSLVNNGKPVPATQTAAFYKVSYGYSEAYDGYHDYLEWSPSSGMDIGNIISPSIIFACSNNRENLMFECGPYATHGQVSEHGEDVVPRSTGGVGTCRLGNTYLHSGNTSNFWFSDGHIENLKDTTFQQWMTFL